MSGPYASKSEILALAQKIKSDLVLADISDKFLNAATEIIENRTKVWGITTADQYIDGRGETHIWSPTRPINSLSAVKIIYPDTSEESLTLTGSDRQVWWNGTTGEIKRINSEDDITREESHYTASKFPEGIKNIKLSGNFGEDQPGLANPFNTLGILQTMLVFQMLGMIYPETFRQIDLIEEKIGEYSYRLGDNQYSKDPNNTKKGLDGYIEYLFKSLPRDQYMDMVLAI